MGAMDKYVQEVGGKRKTARAENKKREKNKRRMSL